MCIRDSITPARQSTLVIEHHKQSTVRRARLPRPLDQVQTVLVVRELHEGPFYFFSFILFLLEFEDISIELLLEGFVRIVDAELLEGIC